MLFSYVYGAKFDTKGLMYPRALQQLFVGLYIAEICIIGLFAIGMGSSPTAAVGPLIMMILFTIFTALYHISLNSALDPLLKFLPKTLETEERRLLAMEEHDIEASEAVDGKQEMHPTNGDEKNGASHGTKMVPAPHKKPNLITKFFRPDVYTDYYTLRRLVPRDFAKVALDEKTANETYHHPSVVSQPPVLWIPRDDAGVSRQEVHETSKVIPISDAGAELDDKNKIVWSRDDLGKTPVYQDKIYY